MRSHLQIDRQRVKREAAPPRRPPSRAELARALQRSHGNAAVARLLQRKVGFEFETPWTLKAPANLIGSDTPVVTGSTTEVEYDDQYRQKPPRALWHASPDMKAPVDEHGRMLPEFAETEREVPAYGGWFGMTRREKVLPKYQGFGNLEFITEAFEESEQGLTDLSAAVRQIVTLVTAFFQFYPGNIPVKDALRQQGVAWGDFVSNKARRDHIVVDTSPTPKGTLYAAIQLTAGIKREKVLELIAHMARQTDRGKLLLQRGFDGATYRTAGSGAGQAVTNVSPDFYNGLDEPAKRTYAGSVIEVAHVIIMGALAGAAIDQAKYNAPVLSRTNLGHISASLPMGAPFKQHVLYAAGQVDPGRKLFPNASKLYQGTVGDWLDEVIAGSDPVNWGQSKDDPRWQPQQVGAENDRAIGHVHEFRSLDTVDVTRWLVAALAYFEAIRALNVSGHV